MPQLISFACQLLRVMEGLNMPEGQFLILQVCPDFPTSVFSVPRHKKNVFRSESKLKVTYEIGKANVYVVDVSIKYGKITHIR